MGNLMNTRLWTGMIILLFVTSSISFNVSSEQHDLTDSMLNTSSTLGQAESSYIIQWQKNYGTSQEGGRYQGPQPIGDCDNDGENEWLLAGRDGRIDIMEWNNDAQTYESSAVLHSPFYFFFLLRERQTEESPPCAGGFAIGDLTGDGENEIAATWYSAVYKYIAGSYRLIGFNSWIFRNHGGNGDCFIGDCDNDGQNELIMSGGGGTYENQVPEIVVHKWNGWRMQMVASYDHPGPEYAYMAGVGDPDNDGDNEITVGITNYGNGPNDYNRLLVLDWNPQTETFDETVLMETSGWEEAPFGGWCEDSDADGIDEIHFGYASPRVTIFDWDGNSYFMKYDKIWPGEGWLIESLNVGDVDNDGFQEVCAATDIVHILEWNGTTYVEEACINETHGDLAVCNIGDLDNDGKNEMNVAPVFVDRDEEYISWVFEYVES